MAGFALNLIDPPLGMDEKSGEVIILWKPIIYV
jgi:hypothetical protein